MTDRRLLLVHAHPDDEAIPTGVTIARYAARGASVTLVTCTLGEAGEIVDPELAHLDPDALGEQRLRELHEAAAVLGISDVRVLGGPGRWRDSGMIGTPENDDPRCFWRASVDEAAAELAAVIREVRPQVVVTYDDNGGYGHPDHIQAHRVTMAAVDAAAKPADDGAEPWTVAKLYYSAVPKSLLQAALDYSKSMGVDFFDGAESIDDLPMGVPDDEVTSVVVAPEALGQKRAAMRAHRSQIGPDSLFLTLPDEIALTAFGTEHFMLIRGEAGGPRDEAGRETDLFGGL